MYRLGQVTTVTNLGREFRGLTTLTLKILLLLLLLLLQAICAVGFLCYLSCHGIVVPVQMC